MPNFIDLLTDPFELAAATFNAIFTPIDDKLKELEDAVANVEFDPSSIAVGGRLTLSSTLPVTTSDVTAATTLYFLPHKGSYIPIYDGADWVARQIPSGGVSISVPAAANTNYDVYVVWSGSALALQLVAWSNNTTRSVALGTQDGIYVDSTAPTRRYVGTIRTTGVSGQCEDSKTKRFCWNAYNQVRRTLEKFDTTASYVYTTAAFRQANANSANKVEIVRGLNEDEVLVTVNCNVQSGTGFALTGVGVDSTTVNSAGRVVGAGSGFSGAGAVYRDYPTEGYHAFNWIESGTGSTTTWYPGFGGQSAGISGQIIG